MIHLVTCFAQSDNQDRASEYDLCLAKNIANQYIDTITLLVEEAGSRSTEQWNSPKISWVHVGRRATYDDLVKAADEKNGIVIIANADVYFDWTAKMLAYIDRDTLYAITCADRLELKHSSDAWVYMPQLALDGCDWSLGRLGCERVFCDVVRTRRAWRICNPCPSVRLTHVHQSQVRSPEYYKRVEHGNPPIPAIVEFDTTQLRFVEPHHVSSAHMTALRRRQFRERMSMGIRKVSVGSGGQFGPGWIGLEMRDLDLLKPEEFGRFFDPFKMDVIFAEHVFEHLTEEDGERAAAALRKHISDSGRLRIAVPDGYRPDPEYIEHVRPRGTGLAEHDHKVLYTHASLTAMLLRAGYRVELLEYCNLHGNFIHKSWDSRLGKVRRSRQWDHRNADGQLRYTSIIIDAFPERC